MLGELPEEYIIFSGIVYDNSEIAHVVFSRKQGLFIINNAAGKGEVTDKGSLLHINNKPHSEVIHKSLRDAFWLRSTIRQQIGVDAPINSLAVFENASVKIERPILGVTAVESRNLIDAITRSPEKTFLEDGVVMVLRELQGVRTINRRGT